MRFIDAFLAALATGSLLLRVVLAVPTSAPTDSYKIYTAAGDGSTIYSGDGTSAINAGIKGPLGIVIDSSGNVYVSDQNNRIRKITTSTGIISTYVGTGTAGYNVDNVAATSAAINDPHGLGIDSSNNIYIADAGNNRIRKVSTSTDIITTIAGTGATGTPTAVAATDGSAATSALLFCPQGVALDSSGNNKNISKL
jgi:streptogramin lyase